MNQHIDWSDVESNVTHIHGPKTVEYGEDELLVHCLVRDGESHIQSFMEHYFALGVKHIVFLDNGSQDNTIDIARSCSNITILHSDLSFKHYKFAMKQYLFKRFGCERWSLCADIDELFDYPFSDVIELESFIRYLNTHAYTAVVAYMLDMFSEDSLQEWLRLKGMPVKDVYRFYDLSNIYRLDFEAFCPNNILSNPDIYNYRGGIRHTLFGTYDRITKTPLVYGNDQIKPIHNSTHKVENAAIADMTVVLYHFKFADNFDALVKRVAYEENYYNDSEKYKKILKYLKSKPDLLVKQETSQELNSIQDLVDNRFLVISEQYKNWVSESSQVATLPIKIA